MVRYEDLLLDVLPQVERMLHFLKVPYNKTELVVKLESEFDDFRRNPSPHSNYVYYNPFQMMDINHMIAETVQELEENDLESYGIEEYVHI